MRPPQKFSRDLSARSFVSFFMLTTAAISTSSSLSGCAHFRSAGDPDPRSRRRTLDSGRGGLPAAEQVIRAEPHSGDPLTSLEHELTQVHSERVIVSAALLKSLVKNERLHQTQCKTLSGQLEAIKNIDFEETGTSELAEAPRE